MEPEVRVTDLSEMDDVVKLQCALVCACLELKENDFDKAVEHYKNLYETAILVIQPSAIDKEPIK